MGADHYPIVQQGIPILSGQKTLLHNKSYLNEYLKTYIVLTLEKRISCLWK